MKLYHGVFYVKLFGEYEMDYTPILSDEFTPLDCDISWWIVPGTLDLED